MNTFKAGINHVLLPAIQCGWVALAGQCGVSSVRGRTRPGHETHTIHSGGRAGWSEPPGGGCAWSLPGAMQGEAGVSLNDQGLQQRFPKITQVCLFACFPIPRHYHEKFSKHFLLLEKHF